MGNNDMYLWKQAAVATLDEAPPSVKVESLAASAAAIDSVKVVVRLSEPGVAFCRAVPANEPAPSEEDIKFFSSSAPADEYLRASIQIGGLYPDREYAIYCGARDNASQFNGGRDNWAPDSTIVQTRFRVHTPDDVAPPVLLVAFPENGAFADCEPDGATLGCMTTVTLTFDEDVFRGSGNVSLICLANFVSCKELHIPVEQQTFDGGLLTVQNRKLYFVVQAPLVDNTIYGVTIQHGALVDARGNGYELTSETCPAWLKPSWKGHLNSCAPTLSFVTPS